MAEMLSGARKSLERTPEQLPILAQTGVVDAGGQGLVLIMKDFLSALRGEEILRWTIFRRQGGRHLDWRCPRRDGPVPY